MAKVKGYELVEKKNVKNVEFLKMKKQDNGFLKLRLMIKLCHICLISKNGISLTNFGMFFD
ncbi:MAG: hypothetical protein K2K06_01350 [Oscillospiraceae bacterium]|nr:hypothetical protein [Oscillospiraceae bacterium]